MEAEPSPEHTPRACRLPKYKGGALKARYATEEEAERIRQANLHARPLLETYHCKECGFWHLGNRRLTEEEWKAEQARRAALRR